MWAYSPTKPTKESCGRLAFFIFIFFPENREQEGLMIASNPLYWPLTNLYLHMFL